MHRWFFLAAFLVLAATFITWKVLGGHTGFTKNTVLVEKIDEITEIVYQEPIEKFVPGVDFLATGTAAAGALGVIGLVIRSRKKRMR